MNVYAVTAANAEESSWGTYCYPDDTIHGEHVGSCLGDLFSVNWMENTDASNPDVETLSQQFQVVHDETTKSHVLKFEDQSFTNEVIGEFEGDIDVKREEEDFFTLLFKQQLFKKEEQQYQPNPARHTNVVDSRDAKLHHLYAKVMKGGDHKAHLDLSEEINYRMKVDHIFTHFNEGSFLQSSQEQSFPLPRDVDCLRTLIQTYEQNCHKLDEYSFK